MLSFAKSFAIIFILTSGVAGQQKTNNSISQKHKMQAKPFIELRRTPCYGDCWSYEVSIYTDGKVVFNGLRRFYEPSKKIESQITPKQLKELNATIERIKYFSLNKKYIDKTDGCSTVLSDFPSAIITIKLGNREKKINHYYGCVDGTKNSRKVYPYSLYELESEIDQVVNVEQWR